MPNYTHIRPGENGGHPTAFWGEIAPSEHLVQFYEEESVFLDTLEGFVAGGLKKGEAVVIIATPEHRMALRRRLNEAGIDVDATQRTDQYLVLDCEESLREFMVNGWPDAPRFHAFVHQALRRARAGDRKVRAFGEMVAMLWAGGMTGATVQLEHLWHSLCREETFSLFCAYPRAGFTASATDSMEQICTAHSMVLK